MRRFSALIVALLLLGGIVSAQRDVEKEMIQSSPMYSVLKKGDIPAIYDPEFQDAGAASDYYHNNEPLLVVAAGDTVRGYSTWHLDRHEIVNDRLGGIPLAVTW